MSHFGVYDMEVEKLNDGTHVARFVDFPECGGRAKSRRGAMKKANDALIENLEAYLDENGDLPEPVSKRAILSSSRVSPNGIEAFTFKGRPPKDIF